jgi:endonuclease G
MLITSTLVEASERRMALARIDPPKLDSQLGDGPIEMCAPRRERRFRQLIADLKTPELAGRALERIVNGNDLVGINYLAKGMAASRPVCRIQLREASGEVTGFATGFLIGPGVLMTNHHVFGRAADANNSLAEFDYEFDLAGNDRPVARFAFDTRALFYANEQLDFAVVALKPKSEDGTRDLKSWGWLPLSGEPGKSDLGEYLTIIQHPGGERKQVCVRENKLLKYEGDTVWYMTDTLGGSSGSPVFNRFWQVVALHHSGVPRKDKKGNWLTKDGKIWDQSMDETQVDWIANEGIRISSLVRHLTSTLKDHPLIAGVLAATAPPVEAATALNGSRPDGSSVWVEQSGDTVSLVVPLRFPIQILQTGVPIVPQPAAAIPQIALPAVDLLPDSLPVEAVHINQKTLGTRPGYKPDFLGKGKLLVPLPKIPAALKDRVATLTGKPVQSELKYFNYSVVMRKDRKLAFFSAVNIDGGLQQDVGKREGDSWLRDPRVAKDAQIGDEFYGKQKTFEADRSKNPFDRGHLVRRLDGTWGKTVDEAKEHGDDTFHFTNAAPQFWSFNEGKKLWLGLEEFVLDQVVADERKACVINGPVFDGPLAPEGGRPDAGDPRRRDPVFGEVAIPKYFWKLMVIVRDGKLAAAAFLLSQQDQILEIDRIHESAILEKLSKAEAKVFQISVADLARFTNLDFGKLAQADTSEAAGVRVRELQALEDVRF